MGMVDSVEIGRRLRELRHYRPQREIADAVGVSDSVIGSYERGERVPSDSVKVKLAELYGKTVQEIFFDSSAT